VRKQKEMFFCFMPVAALQGVARNLLISGQAVVRVGSSASAEQDQFWHRPIEDRT
jgi:hypothetical protein